MSGTILLIDDDKLIHKVVSKYLDSKYILEHAYSGEEGIALFSTIVPDAILLDVEMPGKNGYQVCQNIRELGSDIPIIFLSGKSNVREIMLGYELGADDFIVKPFEGNLLNAKLDVVLRYAQQKQALAEQVKTAEDTAFNAMTGSSALGQVMHFVEQSYGVAQLSTLADKYLALIKNWQLKSVVMFYFDQESHFYSTSGAVKPLEEELLIQGRNSNRFIDFGCRTIINYPLVSVLIKNMPLDDPEQYGRLKDLFPPLLGAIDAKLHALEVEYTLALQSKKLTDSFTDVRKTLVNLASVLNQNQSQSYEELNQLFVSLEEHIPRLGLEDDQEKFILDSVQSTIEKVSGELTNTDQTNRVLAKVLLTMQHLVDEQNELVKAVQQDTIRLQGESVNNIPDDGYEMDVELF
ncbi:response regulator transcription factor [Catenovulum maritimum]|uniref:Response regulatory domain-containing protein n=1 Tax=Catenovulum maritimum TaxID=1513271 RepID=A0A0J8GTL2_9ALTE|nr:response regulator [Catenovulum maritimum]KMT66077.1 hypothetical protein XM47_06440 [Catenovulum maritimum]